MQENETVSQAITIGLGGIYGVFRGLNYQLFFTLTIIMLIDIIIGVLFAFMNGEFLTKKMKKGIITKIILILLLLAMVLFQSALDEYGVVAPFSNMFTGVLIFMEITSILETFAENNVILPNCITSWFEKAKDKLNEDSDL